MSKILFFSWQSDLPNRENRSFIEKCINTAIKELKKDDKFTLDFICDRDTKSIPGSPDITQTIFEKIDKSALFICDISIINSLDSSRKCPNPNVLIELGYASRTLGWDRMICLYNLDYGRIEDIPFDLRQKRILTYSLQNNIVYNEMTRISKIIMSNIQELFSKGLLFNPLYDYMKGKIDKCLLDLTKKACNILYGSLTLGEGLEKTVEFIYSSQEVIKKRVWATEFLGFFFINNFETALAELKIILDKLLSSNYFSRDWVITVLEVIDWIRIYQNISSERYHPYPITQVGTDVKDKYFTVLAHNTNTNTPPNSYLLLKRVSSDSGIVQNTADYALSDENNALQICRFNPESYDLMVNRFMSLSKICKSWLNQTDGDFILDPDIYYIK